MLSINNNSFSIINRKNNNCKFKNIEISRNKNIKISSSYENINIISKYKFADDKQFQSEIKKIVKKNYFEKIKRNNKHSSLISLKYNIKNPKVERYI